MNTINIRRATINDIPFLTKSIIEAEMSGTDVLSYATIFGLNYTEITTFISEMLSEEIDDCEMSISSFLIAEINGQTAAALSGWLENANGIPSAVLKGNLLNGNFIIIKF
jgi:N-acetylglutamate synthase-like GNAT family acetyltransferase